jgi:hypothetical protein
MKTASNAILRYLIDKISTGLNIHFYLSTSNQYEEAAKIEVIASKKDAWIRHAEAYFLSAGKFSGIFIENFAIPTFLDKKLVYLLRNTSDQSTLNELNYAVNKGECLLYTLESRDKVIEEIQMALIEQVASKQYSHLFLSLKYNKESINQVLHCKEEFANSSPIDTIFGLSMRGKKEELISLIDQAENLAIELYGQVEADTLFHAV